LCVWNKLHFSKITLEIGIKTFKTVESQNHRIAESLYDIDIRNL